MPPSDKGLPQATLLSLRDDLAVVAQLVTALLLACQSPHLPRIEAGALCALADTVREKLKTCVEAADELMVSRRGL